MTDVALDRMDAEAFLEWCLDREGRWELIDGLPTQVDLDAATGMAGATDNHDRIVVNLIVALHTRLKGGPCRPSTADKAARMAKGNIRRPDVTVDCGQSSPHDLESKEPTIFFEVLSPSTQSFDFVVKSNEYRDLVSLRHFALVHQDRAEVVLFTWQIDGSWNSARLKSIDATLELTALDLTIPLNEIYDGVPLAD